MPACTGINPAAGSAETLVTTVDCYIQSTVQAGYANLLGSGSAFHIVLTIALTLYVAIVGYRLMFGRSTLSMGEMAPRMILIGAILALTSNWATYQVLVYDVLTDGPQEIAGTINPDARANANSIERVDVLAGRMVDLADAWAEFDARVAPSAPPAIPNAPIPLDAADPVPQPVSGLTALGAPKDSLGPNMLLISSLMLVLASAGTLVIAKIILGLLLLLGPIFAVFALFPSTRGLALGWGRAALMMAFVPVMAMLTTAGVVALLDPIILDMYVSANRGIFSLRSAVAILIVMLIMIAVCVQLFRVGRTIISGWTMPQGLVPFAPGTASTGATPLAADPALSPQMAYADRVQSLIGSIEKTALASSAQTQLQSQGGGSRAILLPPRMADATPHSAANSNFAQRGKLQSRTSARISAVRAPIRPIRSLS
jgi:type IV secretion system protein VirB6